MAHNKRTLDSFVTVTKKTCITSPSEQTEVDDLDLNTINTDQLNNANLDQTNEINSNNIDQNLTVIDSHPETHDNDIGCQLSQHNPPNDEIKYLLLTKLFRPDNKYIFPNQPGKNGTVRRFMAAWLTQYSFLSYSPYYECAFCSACALFSPLVSNQSLAIFVHYPCSRFEQLKHFVTNIKFHLNSKNHKTAVERATNFIRTSENLSSSINYQIDRNRIEAIEKNKAILLSIIKVVITCTRQNIALRGHRGEDIMSIRENLDSIEIPSGSNFIALLKQRIDAGDHLLQNHLEKGCRNSTYTSSSVLNEIIELIHEYILSSIFDRFRPSTLYSIIVDGSTDSSNIEQLC